jgi:outer membrane lipoprotein-sorting protein
VTFRWRWLAVLGLVAVLAASPSIVASRSVADSPVSATALLALVKRSESVPYSGYAEATGGLSLPVTDQFGSIADLLGGQTRLRVWFRGRSDWRVDAIGLSGETDVHRNGQTLWNWNYESGIATETVAATQAVVRLPETMDVLPSTLAQRLLSEADAADVTRIAPRRVAGHDVPGLRLRPPEAGSTIDEVDVWVDPASGVPLRVEVRGGGTDVITTQFLDFSTRVPSPGTTAFSPPPGAQIHTSQDTDLAQLLQRLGVGSAPPELAGIARNAELPPVGSIGVYGRGVTEFAAVPLFGRTARSLRTQLAKTAGVTTTSTGQSVAVGPLSLVLTAPGTTPGRSIGASSGWLLTGTVDVGTLTKAAGELVAVSR